MFSSCQDFNKEVENENNTKKILITQKELVRSETLEAMLNALKKVDDKRPEGTSPCKEYNELANEILKAIKDQHEVSKKELDRI